MRFIDSSGHFDSPIVEGVNNAGLLSGCSSLRVPYRGTLSASQVCARGFTATRGVQGHMLPSMSIFERQEGQMPCNEEGTKIC